MKRYEAYPKYKPSGVEWLGDVPKQWEVEAIKWTTPDARWHGRAKKIVSPGKIFCCL